MFLKIIALKMFANFTGKHLCWWASFTEHLSGFQPVNLLKKRLRKRCFFVKSLGASSDRMPLDDYFLYLPVNFEKFFRTQLLYSTSGKLPMKQLFYDKNIMFNRKKINNRNTLAKYFTWQKHSVIAKFKILKGLKKFKKI